MNHKRNPNAIGPMLGMIHSELRRGANNSISRLGLTFRQMDLLWVLENETQGLNLKEVEQKLHLAQSTVAGIVARCEKKGFVTTAILEGDRRVKRVTITEEGKAILASARSDREECDQRLVKGLTPEEQKELIQLLQKVRNSLVGKC